MNYIVYTEVSNYKGHWNFKDNFDKSRIKFNSPL